MPKKCLLEDRTCKPDVCTAIVEGYLSQREENIEPPNPLVHEFIRDTMRCAMKKICDKANS